MPALALEDPMPAFVPLTVRRVVITLDEAAAFLQISPQRARELEAWGRLPCLRSGNEAFVLFGDVIEYQRRREIERQRARNSPLAQAREQIVAEGFDRLP